MKSKQMIEMEKEFVWIPSWVEFLPDGGENLFSVQQVGDKMWTVMCLITPTEEVIRPDSYDMCDEEEVTAWVERNTWYF